MRRSYILAVISVLLWSTMAPMAKSLLGGMPNFEVLCVSSAVAGVTLLLFCGFRRAAGGAVHVSPRQVGRMAWLGFFGFFVYSALYYYGLTELSAQEAVVVNYLWPILLVLCACLILHEPFTGRKAAGLLLSFLGIVVIAAANGAGEGAASLPGIAACAAGAFLYGLFCVLNKRDGMDQLVTMTVIFLTTAACAALAGLLLEHWRPLERGELLGLLWMGVAADAIPFLTWAEALGSSKETAGVANIAYLTPFLSVAISCVVFRESFAAQALVALGLILAGIAVQSASIGGRRGRA